VTNIKITTTTTTFFQYLVLEQVLWGGGVRDVFFVFVIGLWVIF